MSLFLKIFSYHSQIRKDYTEAYYDKCKACENTPMYWFHSKIFALFVDLIHNDIGTYDCFLRYSLQTSLHTCSFQFFENL